MDFAEEVVGANGANAVANREVKVSLMTSGLRGHNTHQY